MTQPVAILVPVLARPHRVRPLLDSIAAATPEPHSVLFIADPDDHAQIEAIREHADEVLIHGGSYAAKINAGVRATDEPLVVLAADDLVAHAGWLPAALERIEAGAEVVGLNDLIPRPERPTHATHFLLTRRAAELPCIDGTPGPLHEGYGHWRVDDELIATASKRGLYAYAEDAVLEHQHPMTGAAPDDETYRKGRSTARLDARLFRRRSRLWTSR